MAGPGDLLQAGYANHQAVFNQMRGGATGSLGAAVKSVGNWVNTRSQVGPVNAPMGTEHPTVTDPQGPPVDFAASNGGNGDGGGEELATRSDLQAHTDTLSGRVDALASSASSGQAGGGGQAQYQQSGSPQTPYETPVSPLLAQAQKHQGMLESMINARGSLAQTRANFSANASARAQASAANTVKPAGSAVGMSDAYAQRSFYGQQGSGNGVSAGNWESARWSR